MLVLYDLHNVLKMIFNRPTNAFARYFAELFSWIQSFDSIGSMAKEKKWPY